MCDCLSKAECVPAFTRESERVPFVREVEKRDEKRFGTELRRQLLDDICGNGFGRKAKLFKPDFWTVKAVRFDYRPAIICQAEIPLGIHGT